MPPIALACQRGNSNNLTLQLDSGKCLGPRSWPAGPVESSSRLFQSTMPITVKPSRSPMDTKCSPSFTDSPLARPLIPSAPLRAASAAVQDA